MAISNQDRKRIQSELDRFSRILERARASKNPESYGINEGEKGDIRRLEDVAGIISGQVLTQDQLGHFDPKYGWYSYSHENPAFLISIYFLSNKNKKIDPKKNLISYKFMNPGEDDTDIEVEGLMDDVGSVSLEDFIELPKTVEGDSGLRVKDIVEMCDYDEIYNIYQSAVLEFLESNFALVYHLFTGRNIYKVKEYVVYGEANTLYVSYDPVKGKYKYSYNPRFILSASIEEFIRNSQMYKSLRDCYVYCLAFFIAHEMMHIITNNTEQSAVDLDDAGARHKDVENIVMDSYVNCWLSERMVGFSGIKKGSDGLAPMPSIGIGDTIPLRCQHNVGFKRFDSVRDLLNSLVSVYGDSVNKKLKLSRRTDLDLERSLLDFEGADVFVRVKVPPKSREIRKNSIKYQKFVNDIVRVITDGSAYSCFQKLTEEERMSNKDVLPIGTLVRIKRSATICVVIDYNAEAKVYILGNTEATLVREDNEDGTFTCSYDYKEDGSTYGVLRRNGFKPFDPKAPENTWIEGTPKLEHEDKLTDDELNQIRNFPANLVDQAVDIYGLGEVVSVVSDIKVSKDGSSNNNVIFDVQSCQGKSDAECKKILGDLEYQAVADMVNGKDKEDLGPAAGGMQSPQKPKVLNVGDIVFVRSLGRYGRIVSSAGGQFELEEMSEDGVRVLDDSDLH